MHINKGRNAVCVQKKTESHASLASCMAARQAATYTQHMRSTTRITEEKPAYASAHHCHQVTISGKKKEGQGPLRQAQCGGRQGKARIIQVGRKGRCVCW